MIVEGVACVYLDDILIFTKTLSEHRNIMQRVLECLWEHKLYLKPEKCEFKQKQIEYLGVIVLEGWVNVGDPSKIRPYSSLTGLLISLFSLTAFSSRKPKNKRKAE